MRRATRGMWEHVKRHGIPIARGAKRSSEYSLLYSVMLSYMAWVFPCPAEIEKRMAGAGPEARLTWLTGVRRTSARVARADHDMDEAALRLLASEEGLDAVSADEVLEAGLVTDSLRAEVALPPPEVAEAYAKSAVASDRVVVTAGGSVVRRRKGGAPPRKRDLPELPSEEADDEDLSAWESLLSVGERPELPAEDYSPNAAPPQYMTMGAFWSGADFVANVEGVMPSAIRMMAAMTLPF